MGLAPGSRLGPYEIQTLLGAGGMGEVYTARDTRLDRVVAVKILSTTTSSSPAARERFEREAKAIAQLSHPHICALYDVGDAPNPSNPSNPANPANPESQIPNPDRLQFLVMELLDGDTLAARLASGPLPLAQVLRYGIEIADALDKAHRHGIVHRDLKPANVMVTKSGVKLLDFGLAKAAAPLFPGASVTLLDTAATPPQLSALGTIAGTLQYMSPEQLEGRPADARSDIFAFGAVLFEMATGRKAFSAASPVAVASAILHGAPPPMGSLNPALPGAIDRIVRTCLAKDPDERWQSAHDIGLQLLAIADRPDTDATSDASTEAASTAARQRRGWIRWVPWTIATVAIVGAAAVAWLRPAREVSASPAAVRFSVAPPAGGAFFESYEIPGLSISPDGLRIAFAAVDASSPLRIWVRPVAELDARPIAGTDGATSMFWSPDGRSLGFIARGKMKRVDLRGGAPVTICDVREGIGTYGTWGSDGRILFSSIEGEAIFSVATSGGVPTAIMKPDAARGEARLNWPFFLPDGRRFLYLQRRRDGSGDLMVAEPGKAPRQLMPLQSPAQYVDPGYLVYAADRTLVARRFDLSRGEVVGEPFSIADTVAYFLSTTTARFAVSPNGTLAYQSHHDEQRLAWFDRSGREAGSIGERGEYQVPRISPDERRVAYSRITGAAFDVWAMDLERHVESHLTLNPSSEGAGPWMPDGRSLFFGADRGGPPQIFRKDLTTGAETAVLPASGTFQAPETVSPDGKTLLYTQRAAKGGDIWMFSLDGSRPPVVIVETPFDEENVRFSPDGRFFSFDSNASGRREVHVAPFPTTGETIRISTGGGAVARWSRDGKTLFYLSLDGHLMSVPIQTSPPLRVGMPVPLFEVDAKRRWFDFDVSSAGRFLAVVSETRANDQPLTVVLNSTADLAK